MPLPLEVVAAILIRPDGRVFLASRPQGKVYAGYWEFPGGKVEVGETLDHALARELKEELGIIPTRVTRWITKVFTYPHATVRLNFFRVWQWQGDPHPHEGQTFAWVEPARCEVAPLLPANFPVLKGLSLPPLYGITQAKTQDAFLPRLRTALEKGLRLIQVRNKELAYAERLNLARKVVDYARPYGAKVLVNGTPELARAAELADFALLSPVLPSASHPGEPGLSWETFALWAAASPIPVYALGGQNMDTLNNALGHGGHGIAMLREVWK